ncbi:unnamed protein product [Caenorhabditis auriculariae]|uniref:Uncharacterized protein n=1 Tax=Caenorhabditis auriculariae TaxID=2777116 RepID=A0A8S1H2A0_9PELO|nr:unnamed protein product [Caenorhabditis auriculariae]
MEFEIKPDPEHELRNFQLLIHNATTGRNIQKIESLIKDKSDDYIKKCLNMLSDHNPLVEACERGFHDIVRLFVRLGAEPLFSFCRKSHLTALEIAVKRLGSLDVLRAIVEATDFDLKLASERVEIPLVFLACQSSNLKMVNYLCEHGLSVQDRDREGLTCLMKPEFYKTEESRNVFKYLVEHGLSVDATTTDGQTALHFAAKAKNYHLVQLLIDSGAKLSPDKHGSSPLIATALLTTFEDPDRDIFELLLNYANDEKTRNDALLLNAATIIMEGSFNYRLKLYNKDDKSPSNYLKSVLEADLSEKKEEIDEDIEPNPAYDSLWEARSYKEFDEAEDFWRFEMMQCLIIRERILGPAHPEIRTSLYRLLQNKTGIHRVEISDAMLLYTLSLYHRYEPEISCDLTRIFDLNYRRVQDLPAGWASVKQNRPVLDFLIDFFDDICLALERSYQEKLNDPYNYLVRLPEAAISIYQKIKDEVPSHSEKTDPAVVLDLSRFSSIVNLLKFPLFHLKKIIENPELIPVFASAGANVNAKNYDNQTALASMFYSRFKRRPETDSDSDDEDDDSDDYYDYDSQVFVRDKTTRRVFRHLQKHEDVEDLFVLGNYITLQDMCAEVVEATYKKEYLQKKLPSHLSRYLGL